MSYGVAFTDAYGQAFGANALLRGRLLYVIETTTAGGHASVPLFSLTRGDFWTFSGGVAVGFTLPDSFSYGPTWPRITYDPRKQWVWWTAASRTVTLLGIRGK